MFSNPPPNTKLQFPFSQSLSQCCKQAHTDWKSKKERGNVRFAWAAGASLPQQLSVPLRIPRDAWWGFDHLWPHQPKNNPLAKIGGVSPPVLKVPGLVWKVKTVKGLDPHFVSQSRVWTVFASSLDEKGREREIDGPAGARCFPSVAAVVFKGAIVQSHAVSGMSMRKELGKTVPRCKRENNHD